MVRKLLDLFSARERWQLLGLFLVILVMGLFEIVGVGSIMPFMALVASPELALQNRWLQWLYARGDFQTQTAFLVFVGVIVLIALTLSNAFNMFTTWLSLRFVGARQHMLSRKLMSHYLHQPYQFFLHRNSAELNSNILNEVVSVIAGIVAPLLQVVSKSVVVLALFALLCIVNVGLAFTIAVVLGGAYSLVYTLVRRKQARMARERLEANTERFRVAAEAFGGIKDVKVLGREKEFLDRFSKPSLIFSHNSAVEQMIGQMPRFALESVAFGGILVIVLFLLSSGSPIGHLLPVLSLYALAGYRLMPALQHIYAGVSRMRMNAPALDRLHRDLSIGAASHAPRTPAPDGNEPIVFEREIALQGLSFRFSKSAPFALHDISLRIPRNQTIAFVGATGCGKTTLVDLILGLLQPETGEILVDGIKLAPNNVGSWQRQIGYVPQSIFLSDDSIARNIAFGLPDAEINWQAITRAVAAANLAEFTNTLPDGLQTIIGERGVRLSGGQRQRIGIARALYADPKLLIMDEATSALDGITEEIVMQAIRGLAHEKTIILIAHRLATVRECDRIYVLDEGRVVAEGDYESLLGSSAQFRAMARVPA